MQSIVDAMTSQPNRRIDQLGAFASGLCAVHCAICALLPAAFAALGLGMLLGHEAEWLFTLVAVSFATGALILGWRRHRSSRVAVLLTLGIVGLLGSRVLEMGEEHHGEHHEQHGHGHHEEAHGEAPSALHAAGTFVGVVAGGVLIAGHLLNIRATRRCRRQCG